MGLFSSIIGGVANLAGGLIAGNKLSQNIKDLQDQRAEIGNQKAFSQAHMVNGMYQGAGQSADFQANQTAMLDALRQSNKEATQDITEGQSETAKATKKGQAAAAVAQMANADALANQNRRDQAYSTGQQNLQAWQNQDNKMLGYINDARTAQAQSILKATEGFSSAAQKMPF